MADGYDPMLEIQYKNKLRGKLHRKLQNWQQARTARKEEYKRIYHEEEQKLQRGFIRRRVAADLKRKYLKPRPTFGWSVPKPGQRSVGGDMQERMNAVMGMGQKKKKQQSVIF